MATYYTFPVDEITSRVDAKHANALSYILSMPFEPDFDTNYLKDLVSEARRSHGFADSDLEYYASSFAEEFSRFCTDKNRGALFRLYNGLIAHARDVVDESPLARFLDEAVNDLQ